MPALVECLSQQDRDALAALVGRRPRAAIREMTSDLDDRRDRERKWMDRFMRQRAANKLGSAV